MTKVKKVRSIRYFAADGGSVHTRTVGRTVNDVYGIVVTSIELTENEFGQLEYQVWVSNSKNEAAIWKTVPYELAEAEYDFMELLK